VDRPDLVQKEVDAPDDRWCEGAQHFVPDDAVFQGKPTRFFKLSGRAVEEVVVVCEPCLVVANFRAAFIRKRNKLREELGIDND